MKTPIWESSPGALETLLETNTWVECELYTYTLADGVTVALRATTADVNVTVSGVTWLTGDPVHGPVGSTRPVAHWKIGLDVDTWAVRVSPQKANPVTGAPFPALLNNAPWLQSCVNGALDGASLTVDRAYFPNWSTGVVHWGQLGLAPVGVLRLFAGPIGSVDIDQGGAIITANDWRIILKNPMPRNLFTTNCRHRLYDAGCTLVKSSFSRTGSVSSVLSQSSFISAVAAPPGSGTYALGSVTFTSGLNNGFSRFVRDWNSGTGTFTLLTPLPYAIGADSFTAAAGCNKTVTACGLFSNYPTNWGGEQFIPAPEVAI